MFKHGAYLYNNLTFVNKLDAFDHALKIKDKNPYIKFYFHDNVYSKLTEEPSMSLRDLYALRARQLRGEYDYIILLYSGGADSHEMLNTFLENNILVDEVQTLYPQKLTEGKVQTENLKQDDTNILAEHILVTFPELKKLSTISPKTKIRIIDTTDSFFSIDDNYLSSYYNHFFNSFYPTQMNTAILDKETNELAIRKKVCMVWANNKPDIVLDNQNNFYYRFNDIARQFSPWLSENGSKSPIHFESFYWSADVPFIPIKQSFVLMRQMQYDLDHMNHYSYNLLKSMNIGELNKWMKPVIYRHWDQRKYQAKLNMRDWHSLDENIYKYIPHVKDLTMTKMKYYIRKYHSLNTFKIDSVDFKRPSLGVFFTQKYKIGRLQVHTK
jgi:hypothetical protein